MNKEEINGMSTIPDQEKILYTSGYVKDLKDKMEDLQQRIDKVIKDLELTKEKNIPFLDEYGNALIYIDVDHIDYLIKILRGKDNGN